MLILIAVNGWCFRVYSRKYFQKPEFYKMGVEKIFPGL